MSKIKITAQEAHELFDNGQAMLNAGNGQIPFNNFKEGFVIIDKEDVIVEVRGEMHRLASFEFQTIKGEYLYSDSGGIKVSASEMRMMARREKKYNRCLAALSKIPNSRAKHDVELLQEHREAYILNGDDFVPYRLLAELQCV